MIIELFDFAKHIYGVGTHQQLALWPSHILSSFFWRNSMHPSVFLFLPFLSIIVMCPKSDKISLSSGTSRFICYLYKLRYEKSGTVTCSFRFSLYIQLFSYSSWPNRKPKAVNTYVFRFYAYCNTGFEWHSSLFVGKLLKGKYYWKNWRASTRTVAPIGTKNMAKFQLTVNSQN